MKFIYVLFFVTILSGILFLPSASAQLVPEWVKNTAGWWATDVISETEFVNAIEFLVKENIIQVDVSQASETSQSVPEWIKNTAGWWADHQISDGDFVNAIQYLIKVGIMTVPQAEQTTLAIKPSDSILDTTSFFDAIVEREGFLNKAVDFANEEVNWNYLDYPADVYDINSKGFRGQEFSSDKPNNTYRIVTIGGSTTFGIGVTDENTWPVILEKKLHSINLDKNIEVINAGIPAIGSFYESKLIKEKIIHYDPDLIIVYDGANDQGCKLPERVTKNHIMTKEIMEQRCGVYSPSNYEKVYAERWSEICKSGKQNGFETVIITQPIPHFDKFLTDQELDWYFKRPEHSAYVNAVNLYAQEVSNTEMNCAKTADFTNIFDFYLKPIYFDYVHPGNLGNEILASKVLELISPILEDEGIIDCTVDNCTQPNIMKPSQDPELILKLYEANWGELSANQKNFVGQDLSGKDFSNSDLRNKIFFGSDLRNANFQNSILSGSDFSLANLENANFKNAVIDGIKLRQTTLNQTNFSNVDFSNVDLMNVDLSNAILKNSNLSNKDFKKTFLFKADLTGANVTNSDLALVYLEDSVLRNAHFGGALLYETDLNLIHDRDLSGTILTQSVLSWSNLVGIDLSGKNLSGTNFHGATLTGQDFTDNVTLFNNKFQEADLSNANFEGTDMFDDNVYAKTFKNKAYLDGLSSTQIVNEIFGRLIQFHIISTAVSGDDLKVNFIIYMSFVDANLENANFKNADLKFASFLNANLTNANLSGADLSKALLEDANLDGANLDGANLDGANLDGANLKCINHPICLTE